MILKDCLLITFLASLVACASNPPAPTISSTSSQSEYQKFPPRNGTSYRLEISFESRDFATFAALQKDLLDAGYAATFRQSVTTTTSANWSFSTSWPFFSHTPAGTSVKTYALEASKIAAAKPDNALMLADKCQQFLSAHSASTCSWKLVEL